MMAIRIRRSMRNLSTENKNEPHRLNDSRTWSRSNQSSGEIRAGKPFLQDRDDLLVEVLHGHGGYVSQLLQHLVSSLRRACGVHIPQNTINLIDHLREAHNNTVESPGLCLGTMSPFCFCTKKKQPYLI